MLKIDRSWTLFLDRDGVINRKLEADYVKRWEEFEFLPQSLDAISNFSKKFGRIVIVTNQQGIGKGIYSHKDLNLVHHKMLEQITLKGGKIDKIYYCPNLEAEKFKERKPETGMAWKAKKDFPEIIFEKSVMIGDSISDMKFGKTLKMTTFFISSQKDIQKDEHLLIDYRYENLGQIAFNIL